MFACRFLVIFLCAIYCGVVAFRYVLVCDLFIVLFPSCWFCVVSLSLFFFSCVCVCGEFLVGYSVPLTYACISFSCYVSIPTRSFDFPFLSVYFFFCNVRSRIFYEILMFCPAAAVFV